MNDKFKTPVKEPYKTPNTVPYAKPSIEQKTPSVVAPEPIKQEVPTVDKRLVLRKAINELIKVIEELEALEELE